MVYLLQCFGVIQMYSKWKEIVIALLLGLILPATLFSVLRKKPADAPEASGIATVQTQGTETVPPVFEIAVLMDNGSIETMDLDSYLTAVVLQEMPAEFELEALKAQAVVARTYAMRRAATGGKHTGAAVCTDSSCCQGYCPEEEYILNGGEPSCVDKIRTAVTETADQVLLYEGELIEATYFSCSGGKTEDAQAVWGGDIPYLQSVDSPGEEAAVHYTDTMRFSAQEFSQLLGGQLTGEPGTWLEGVTYTDGGGVASMKICGREYTGTKLRQLLGLRSTAFVMTAVGDTVVITTKGFGHRVGMSQYGADAMAVQGSSYEQILAHYYQGTVLGSYAAQD